MTETEIDLAARSIVDAQLIAAALVLATRGSADQTRVLAQLIAATAQEVSGMLPALASGSVADQAKIGHFVTAAQNRAAVIQKMALKMAHGALRPGAGAETEPDTVQ